MRVFVYWNLHKGLWSVKALEGPYKGLVIHRAHRVLLSNAAPKVSEAGRQRVIREGRKNVHAGIVGDLVDYNGHDMLASTGLPVSYNPYKGPTFYYKGTGEDYTGSEMAYLAHRVVIAL